MARVAVVSVRYFQLIAFKRKSVWGTRGDGSTANPGHIYLAWTSSFFSQKLDVPNPGLSPSRPLPLPSVAPIPSCVNSWHCGYARLRYPRLALSNLHHGQLSPRRRPQGPDRERPASPCRACGRGGNPAGPPPQRAPAVRSRVAAQWRLLAARRFVQKTHVAPIMDGGARMNPAIACLTSLRPATGLATSADQLPKMQVS